MESKELTELLMTIRQTECKCALCFPPGQLPYISRCVRCKSLLKYEPEKE